MIRPLQVLPLILAALFLATQVLASHHIHDFEDHSPVHQDSVECGVCLAAEMASDVGETSPVSEPQLFRSFGYLMFPDDALNFEPFLPQQARSPPTVF